MAKRGPKTFQEKLEILTNRLSGSGIVELSYSSAFGETIYRCAIRYDNGHIEMFQGSTLSEAVNDAYINR